MGTKIIQGDKEIALVPLREIQSALGVYSNGEVFRAWTAEENSFPGPYMKINGTDHWLADQVDSIRELWIAHQAKLSDEKVQELSKETIGKLELLTAVTQYAQRTERANARCYKNARGSSSMNAGRLRIYELQGAIELVNRILGYGEVPPVLKTELNKYLRTAKQHVGM